MAEARMGVNPMPGLQRPGFEIDTSVKVCQAYVGRAGIVVYIPHPKFLWRGIRRTLWKAINKTRVAFMPVPLPLVLATVGAFSGRVITSGGASWLRSGKLANVLWNIDSRNPFARQLPVWFRVSYLAAGTAVATMFLTASVQRFVLRRLLSYHGWLDRANQNSLFTKLWGLTMKHVFLRRISHHLNAYQWCLPRLPLPQVADTCRRYMETVRPLLSAEELAEHEAEMKRFVESESGPLQRRLALKRLVSRNYISGWWLDFVYLRGRDSLPINSNWYGISFADFKPTHSQAARAAVATYLMVRIKTNLDNETVDPQILAGVAPLCMSQYELAFSTTRVPGHEQDRLERFDSHESRHVAVIHNGRIYKLPLYSPKTMSQLSPTQLLQAYEGILQDTSKPEPGEELLPALTCMNRTEWAQVREEYFERDPFNASRLEAVERAVFVVCLSDAEPADEDWTHEGRTYMCGNYHNLWADKSFNLVVTKNAKLGLHAEHSWGDAPALAHILEMMMLCEKAREFYTLEGGVKLLPLDEAKIKAGKFQVYAAEHIDFQVRPVLKAIAEKAVKEFEEKCLDFDLKVGVFSNYGKNFVAKSVKVSPDAFVQMALQLAYFRDQNRTDLTYESSTTRLFRDGRTETIRSVSAQSIAFVAAMEAYKKGGAEAPTKEEVVRLLRLACERHQQYTIDAMRGDGVDRHLFALYVVSVGINQPSAFLKRALSRGWTLSTSQVPPMQCGEAAHKAVNGGDTEFYCPNGGFGPVRDDGYGVCYNVWNGRFYFNVSAKVKAPNTSAERLFGRIKTALDDLKLLFA